MNWFKKHPSLLSLSIPRNSTEITKRVKIVVIDDEEVSFPYKLLRDSGYTIEWWEKIDERKLEKLERNDFDIIILDINGIADSNLSSNDGIGILSRLKQVNPTQIIVAFSGREYDINMTNFFKKADYTLSKPVDFIKAKTFIDQIIEEKITLQYFWKSLKLLLEKEKISSKKIEKIEQEIAISIKENKPINYEYIKNKVLDGLEITNKVMTIISKFFEIVGHV